MHVWYSSRFK